MQVKFAIWESLSVLNHCVAWLQWNSSQIGLACHRCFSSVFNPVCTAVTSPCWSSYFMQCKYVKYECQHGKPLCMFKSSRLYHSIRMSPLVAFSAALFWSVCAWMPDWTGLLEGKQMIYHIVLNKHSCLNKWPPHPQYFLISHTQVLMESHVL